MGCDRFLIIVRKHLAVFSLLGAFLSGGPCVAKDHQGKPDTQPNQANQSQNIVLPTHTMLDPSLATIHGKSVPKDGKETAEEKPLPRFARPEWVIVYITAVYVVISGLTLRAIKKQARQMELQLGVMQRQTNTTVL